VYSLLLIASFIFASSNISRKGFLHFMQLHKIDLKFGAIFLLKYRIAEEMYDDNHNKEKDSTTLPIQAIT